MQAPILPPKDPLLTVRQATQYVGFSRRSLEREVASGNLPPPVKLRGKSMYFLSDVVGYLARLKSQRDGSFSMT